MEENSSVKKGGLSRGKDQQHLNLYFLCYRLEAHEDCPVGGLPNITLLHTPVVYQGLNPFT